MAKFASNKQATNVAQRVRRTATAKADTKNLAGGKAFNLDAKFKLAMLAATTFLKDGAYRTANQTLQEVDRLIALTGPEYAAKVAMYVRNELGMRSISHYIAAKVASLVKGEQWTKKFYSDVVHRPDDATEILACYISLYGRAKIPNSLKKGLGLSLGKFDEYSLGKYRGENNELKLIDLVRLVHPKPTTKNAEALRKLVAGELRSVDTWESALSLAGQNADTELDKALEKAQAWHDMIVNGKIGYMALLRNLRNIMDQASSKVLNAACKMLTDEKLIKKSLVLPFRYMQAYEMVKDNSNVSSSVRKQVLTAIEQAVEISLENVPQFDGKTLVAVDVSGSMTSTEYHPALRGKPGAVAPIKIAALFAAALLKSNEADLILFDSTARYATYPMTKGVLDINDDIIRKASGGATHFAPIFNKANKYYDRIIILSDMQGWVGGRTPQKAYLDYCRKYKANPRIFSFDFAGLGTTQFPSENIFCLAGFSNKTMDLMHMLEENPQAMVDEIEAIRFS